jgi:hypothetical protein
MAVASSTAEPARPDPVSEKRSAPRRPASHVPSITGLRLSPHGAEAKLVDISLTGLLAECTSRLKVGSSLAVLFEGAFTISSVVGRVARCAVATMGRDGVLRYHVGISFNQPIVLEPEPEPVVARMAPAETSIDSDVPVSVPAPHALRNRW